MLLTQENAYKFLGKKVDAEKRLFHYYPLEVRMINDEYFVKDSVGVNYKIPPENDKFNAIHFDWSV